jgi:hypothetical protein
MKKFRSLRLLGLVTILALAFVFVGLSFVQGQVKIQKGKPPWAKKQTYTWSAVILDANESGLKAAAGDPERYDSTLPGWVYEDSESNVNVGVEIRRAPFSGVTKHWTRFYLEIFDPVQIDLEFNPYDAWIYPDTPDALCKYPGGDSTDPWSMFDFMQNSDHPHPSYEKVYFKFNTDKSVDQNEIDYKQWPNNYHGYLDFLADISGPAPLAFERVPCEDYYVFPYSYIEFGGSLPGDWWHGNGDYGYFERISEDVWKVVVGMEKNPYYDYTIGPGDGDDAWATDWYNICVTQNANKKKTYSTYAPIYSSQGIMDIKFEILFIRTKI